MLLTVFIEQHVSSACAYLQVRCVYVVTAIAFQKPRIPIIHISQHKIFSELLSV
jgi:hypothetical protein